MASRETRVMRWTCDQCGQEIVEEAPEVVDGAMAAMAMWHVYGDPPTGWLRLTRWYGTETTQRDFCSIECMMAWMPKAHEALGD